MAALHVQPIVRNDNYAMNIPRHLFQKVMESLDFLASATCTLEHATNP